VVDYDTIKENEYNLSVSMYIEAEDTREEIDIDELNKKISETVEKESRLRDEIDCIIKENF
jgi:type I restriction enzyme M protein